MTPLFSAIALLAISGVQGLGSQVSYDGNSTRYIYKREYQSASGETAYKVAEYLDQKTAKDNWLIITSSETMQSSIKLKQSKDFGSDHTDLEGIDLIKAKPDHGCGTIENSDEVQDNIALIKRGGCSFVSKALNAQAAGAKAVLIVEPTYRERNLQPIDMIQDETTRDVSIAAYYAPCPDWQWFDRQVKGENHIAFVDILSYKSWQELVRNREAPSQLSLCDKEYIQ